MAANNPKMEWPSTKAMAPVGLYYRFKIRSLQDRAPMWLVLLNLMAAYANGDIRLEEYPEGTTRQRQNIMNTGELNDYRLEIFDLAGRIINPTPLSNDDL